jgi:hypothetical protein
VLGPLARLLPTSQLVDRFRYTVPWSDHRFQRTIMSFPEPLEVRFRYSFWDLLLSASFFYRPALPMLLVVAAVVAVVLLADSVRPDPAPWPLLLGGMLCPLVLLGIAGFLIWWTWRLVRTNPEVLRQDVVVRFATEGLQVAGPSGPVISWGDVRLVVETPRFFHFDIATNNSFLLPQHSLSGEAQRASLRALLREQLQGRAILR